MISAIRLVASTVVIVLLSAGAGEAQEQLVAARDFYVSAEYDRALEVLDRLSAGEPSPDDRQQIEIYRTLCLFAVGRRTEADRAIERIITHDPFYRPGSEVPPRAQSAFSDARKRLLPAIAQQQYDVAKATFERGEFEAAVAAFRRVIDVVDDPDTGAAGRQSPLSDLRVLAAGFHDLSVKSIAPPPPPPAPEPVSPPVANAAHTPPRIYESEEAGVRPPVATLQELPPYPGIVPTAGLKGVVEVVINQSGHVESASMVVPLQATAEAGKRLDTVTSSYNKTVLAAVKRWQFTPAQLDGVAVPFRKRVQIHVAPPTR